MASFEESEFYLKTYFCQQYIHFYIFSDPFLKIESKVSSISKLETIILSQSNCKFFEIFTELVKKKKKRYL